MERSVPIGAFLLMLAVILGTIMMVSADDFQPTDGNVRKDISAARPDPMQGSDKETVEGYATADLTVRMRVTAYCLCAICCGKWAEEGRRVTSIGDDAKICDGVAADPKLLPYRTKLDIPGIGIKEVDDTGGGMRQSAKKGIYHIDVRMASHQEARKFGVQWLDVKVLK